MFGSETKNINQVNAEIRAYTNAVANYKQEHRGGSPIQAKVHSNRMSNEPKKAGISTARVMGGIISKIPNPAAKGVGATLQSGAAAGGFSIDKEHADQVHIKFKY